MDVKSRGPDHSGAEVAFLKQDAVLLIRVDAAQAALSYYRRMETVHALMRSLGAGGLLIDGSAITEDLDRETLAASLVARAHPDTQTGVRIAAVLDDALASLRLLCSLAHNRGHCVAVFGGLADALAWLRQGRVANAHAETRLRRC